MPSTPTAGDDDDEEDNMDVKLPDEMNLVGAPTPTQPSQATPPRHKRRDHADISSINVVEGTRGEHLTSMFTSGTGAVRKRK